MAKSSQPAPIKLSNKEEEHLQELKRELQKQLDRKSVLSVFVQYHFLIYCGRDALNTETANLTQTLQSLEAQLEKPNIEGFHSLVLLLVRFCFR